MKNLDAEINKAGYEIAKVIDENLINKILGVLSNDGVYAMWVYCLNKLEWKFEENIEMFKKHQLYKFLEQLDNFSIELDNNLKIIDDEKIKKELDRKENFNHFTQFFQTLSTDLNQLLFFKEILEKALTYARYHAKAMGKK